jgi:hypothetical protein
MKRFLLVVLILSASTSMAQNMSWEWAQGIINGRSDNSYPFAIDSNGNSFVGGVFDNKFIIVNKVTINEVSDRDFFIAKFNNQGSFVWIKTFGVKGFNAIYDILVDKENNLIVTGSYRDTINMNGIGLKSKSGSSAFYAKFTNDCEPIWVKEIYYQDSAASTQSAVRLRSSVLNNKGEIYSCGYLSYPTLFGDSLIIPPKNGQSFERWNVFVAKLDTGANLEWVSPIGSIRTYRELGPVSKIVVGAGGSVAVTGMFYDTLQFGSTSLVCSDQDDVFIVRFDSVGTPTWGKSFGSLRGLDNGENVAIDNEGNVIAIGIFFDSMNIDGIPLVARYRYTPGGPTLFDEHNSYIIKFNSIGELLWARSIYGRGNRTAGLTLDSIGGIYISGQLSDTNIFSDSTIAFEEYSHYYYISKLDSAGGLEWLVNSRKVYNTYYGNESILLYKESVYAVGQFEYPFPYPSMLTQIGTSDRGIFITKLSKANTSTPSILPFYDCFSYPNPSATISNIRFGLSSPSPVTITLHDILGREVLRREMAVQSEGEHEESLDVSELPIGSYIVKISTNGEVFTSRISVVR